MINAFDVLAEPTRRRILDLLREGPRLVGDLTEQLGMSQPGTSKQLRVLRDAGLVTVRRDAQRRWYELRPQPLAEVDAWLAPYRELWTRSLDALERYLDTMPGTPASGTPASGTPASAGHQARRPGTSGMDSTGTGGSSDQPGDAGGGAPRSPGSGGSRLDLPVTKENSA